MKMNLKKSVLRQGALIDGILKNQTEYLKKKAEKSKAKIDDEAVIKKNKIEKNLKRKISKMNKSLIKIKEPEKAAAK